MKKSSFKIIGKCCYDKPKYIVVFNGEPIDNYAVLLCKKHINKKLFHKLILKIFPIRDVNGLLESL